MTHYSSSEGPLGTEPDFAQTVARTNADNPDTVDRVIAVEAVAVRTFTEEQLSRREEIIETGKLVTRLRASRRMAASIYRRTGMTS